MEHISRRRWRNKQAHHSIYYDQLNLICRRGQSFEMGLLFNRAYDPKTDILMLQFTFGKCQVVLYYKFTIYRVIYRAIFCVCHLISLGHVFLSHSITSCSALFFHLVFFFLIILLVFDSNSFTNSILLLLRFGCYKLPNAFFLSISA